MTNRLERVFSEADGLRHVLIAGPGAGDRVYVDLATGALPLPDALAHEARKRGFAIVVTIDGEGRLEFASDEQEHEFDRLTRERSRDPHSAGARPARIPSGTASDGTAGAQADNRLPAGADSLLAAIGRLDRAQERDSRRMLIHFTALGRLLDPEQAASERAKRIFDAVGKLLTVGRGHPGSRIVVTVPAGVMINARRLLSTHDHGSTAWQSVDMPLPCVEEISRFLVRMSESHGLCGSAQAAANQLFRRRYTLSRISEAFRQGLDAGERDLAAMLASEADPMELERVFARLDRLVGLGELKSGLRSLAGEASAMQRAALTDGLAEPPTLHMALLGRPGTGKSEVAKLLAELLHAAGACRRNHLQIATIADIVGPHNSGESISNMRRLARDAAGGVLFIDEAYALAENDWGRQAIDVLVEEMESRRGDLTVVLAGYPDRMQALFQANEGLKSRIPRTYRLPDYSADELCEILDRRATAASVRMTEEARTLAHRIIRRESTRPHANARDVRNLFESWNRVRIIEVSDQLETRHVVDPRTPDWERSAQLANEQAERFKGLPELQDWMQSQIRLSHDTFNRGALPRAPRIAFLGPPGTGKTESARRVGEFLRSCGVLKDGRVIERSMRNFVSSLVGGTLQATVQQFRDAAECVLFIDEIYMFAQDQSGREALNQIVALLTDPEHDSVAVIFAGYDDRMNEVHAVNPGLMDRLQATIRFAWPGPDELACIALAHLEGQHGCAIAAADRATLLSRLAALLASRRGLSDFAGARTAKKVADEIWQRNLARGGGSVSLLDLDDPAPVTSFTELTDAFLHDYPRSRSLLQPLRQIAARIRMQGADAVGTGSALGIRLSGAPGTGKSTFARWIANRLMVRPGRAAAPFVERSAQSLQGVHLGEAQANVRTAFERARGGLLFIDEFHALHTPGAQQNLYSIDIAREVVAQMTNPRNARTVVVIAGYPGPMEDALRIDHGLGGRFPERIELPSPPDAELAAIAHDALVRMFGSEGPVTLGTASPILEEHFARLRNQDGPDFGNCRAADELAKRIYMCAIIRCNGAMPQSMAIEDILEAIDQ